MITIGFYDSLFCRTLKITVWPLQDHIEGPQRVSVVWASGCSCSLYPCPIKILWIHVNFPQYVTADQSHNFKWVYKEFLGHRFPFCQKAAYLGMLPAFSLPHSSETQAPVIGDQMEQMHVRCLKLWFRQKADPGSSRNKDNQMAREQNVECACCYIVRFWFWTTLSLVNCPTP